MPKLKGEEKGGETVVPASSAAKLLDGEEYVRWAYRLLLGREPEDLEAIQNNPFKNDRRRLVQDMLNSPEFQNSHTFSVDEHEKTPAADGRNLSVDNNAEFMNFDINTIDNAHLREYAINGYSTIDGWGIDEYLIRIFLLLDHYQKRREIYGNVFELGVFHGRVLILLGLTTRDSERVVALDIFETFQSHNVDQSGMGTTQEIVARNLKRYGLWEKTDLIVGDSLFTDFTEHSALRNIRFAHIDGAHYVDALVNDLVKTQQVIVPGGVIVVDDYNHVGFPGVNEGCHRFLSFATPRLVVPFAAGNNKLFLTTHSHHADLIKHMSDALKRPRGRLIQIHGFDSVSLEPN
jgi:SAM-dependent methyltransferase